MPKYIIRYTDTAVVDGHQQGEEVEASGYKDVAGGKFVDFYVQDGTTEEPVYRVRSSDIVSVRQKR